MALNELKISVQKQYMLLANSSELLRLASDCERLYIFYGKLCPELLFVVRLFAMCFTIFANFSKLPKVRLIIRKQVSKSLTRLAL